MKYCSSRRVLAGLLYHTENWNTSPLSALCSSPFLCPVTSNLSLRSQLLCHSPWGAFPYLLDWVTAPPSCFQRTQCFHLPFILPHVLPLQIAFPTLAALFQSELKPLWETVPVLDIIGIPAANTMPGVWQMMITCLLNYDLIKITMFITPILWGRPHASY